MSIQIHTEGAPASPEEFAVLSDMARCMAAIHHDKQHNPQAVPSLEAMAHGLVGMLAAHDWKNSDPDAYAVIVALTAVLYIESGAAVFEELPSTQSVH